jgi:hypothetical protein
LKSPSTVGAELVALVQVENDCCSWAAWAVERSADGALVMAAHSKGEGIATQRSRERRVRCRPTHELIRAEVMDVEVATPLTRKQQRRVTRR